MKPFQGEDTMLKKERQQTYFNSIGKAMHRHLLAFYVSPKPVHLHQFRIQVKKLQALLFLIPDRSSAEKRRQYFEGIKPIFKHAGRIRSAYLNLQHLSQDQSSHLEHRLAQEKIIKKETARFVANQRSYLKKLKRMRRELVDDFQDIPSKIIKKRYKKLLKKIAQELSKPDLAIERLHLCRKRIKSLLHFYKLLPKSMARKLQLNTDYLDQLQDAIGKWRDEVLFEGVESRYPRVI